MLKKNAEEITRNEGAAALVASDLVNSYALPQGATALQDKVKEFAASEVEEEPQMIKIASWVCSLNISLFFWLKLSCILKKILSRLLRNTKKELVMLLAATAFPKFVMSEHYEKWRKLEQQKELERLKKAKDGINIH